mgnify:CR=1 FL=1
MFLQENNIPFMETSAKSGLNVDLAFNALARWVSVYVLMLHAADGM